MTQNGKRKTIAFGTKLVMNRYYPDKLPRHGKFDPIHTDWGGGGVTACPVLQKLDVSVAMYGRYAPIHQPFLDHAKNLGIEMRMQLTSGMVTTNAVLGGNRILRVTSESPYATSPAEAASLIESQSDAIAMSGSLPMTYMDFMARSADELSVPLWWNPSISTFNGGLPKSPTRLILQISFQEFSDGKCSQVALARKMMRLTDCTAVIVTDGPRMTVAISRKKPETVILAPAIPVATAVRHIGAGDAFFGGLLAQGMKNPRELDLHRALAVARLVAARHVLGLNPADWDELALFEKSLDRVPSLRAAA